MRLAITILGLMVSAGVASGDGCRTVVPVRHAIVNQVQAVVAPVAAVVPVQVAAYSVGYNAQGDTAQALREIVAELKALRESLGGTGGGTPTTTDTNQTRVEAVMVAKCAACHKPDVAKTKGGNHTLLTADGKLAQGVNLFELWDEVDSGRMPKGGPPLENEDVAYFKAILKEGIKAQKNGK